MHALFLHQHILLECVLLLLLVGGGGEEVCDPCGLMLLIQMRQLVQKPSTIDSTLAVSNSCVSELRGEAVALPKGSLVFIIEGTLLATITPESFRSQYDIVLAPDVVLEVTLEIVRSKKPLDTRRLSELRSESRTRTGTTL